MTIDDECKRMEELVRLKRISGEVSVSDYLDIVKQFKRGIPNSKILDILGIKHSYLWRLRVILKYGDEDVKDSVVNGEKTLTCAAREIMEKRCGVVKHTLRKNRTRIKKSALVIDEQQSKDYGALHFSMVAIGNINLIDIGDPFFNLAIDNVINFVNSRKTKGEK